MLAIFAIIKLVVILNHLINVQEKRLKIVTLLKVYCVAEIEDKIIGAKELNRAKISENQSILLLPAVQVFCTGMWKHNRSRNKC